MAVSRSTSRAVCFSLIVNLLVFSCANGGERIRHTIDSKHLAGNLVGESPLRNFSVQLPAGYDESNQDYPVVYWFPGGRLSEVHGIDIETIDEEFSSGRSVPAIIVYVAATTSFQSTAFFSSDAFGDWEGFLTQEIVPFVDNTYRTQATPDKRGIMGFSVGGLTAMSMPLLAPGTFGAVGANDPSVSFISSAVRTRDEFPPGVPEDDDDGITLEEFFGRFPETVEGFNETGIINSIYGQLAARISPNPDATLLGDLPFNEQGEWIPEARSQWREFDLIDPETIDLHAESLAALKTVTVALPDARRDVATPWTREVVRVMQEAGIPAQGISVVGDHNDSQHERFTALLANVTHAMNDVSRVSIDAVGYGEDFDAIFTNDDSLAVSLPAGWSVSDELANVFRDRTNTPFNGGNIEPIGEGPHIVSASGDSLSDPALGVFLPKDSGEDATIQLEAQLDELNANAFTLGFNVEAQSPSDDAARANAIGLKVSVELDRGEGFEQMLDLASIDLGGGVSFNSGHVPAPFQDASAMRIRWSTDATSVATEDWLVSLDDVEIAFDLLGDFDGNTILDEMDIDLLSTAIRSEQAPAEFDLNGDGTVDAADREYWIHELAHSGFGDANLDRTISFGDFLLFADGFGVEGGWAQGDFDGNGEVEFEDFLTLSRHFGETLTAASVPEPASLRRLFVVLFALTTTVLRPRGGLLRRPLAARPQ